MGIWGHRQALAVREAGADVRVIVLHRIVPPRSALAEGVGKAASTSGDARRAPPPAARRAFHHLRVLRLPPRAGIPGLGRMGGPRRSRWVRQLRRSFPYELIHAHNAVPAGDAVRRAGPRTPLVVSEHGADVLYTAWRGPRGARARWRADSGPPSWCWPTAAGSPSWPATEGPRAPASCTSAPSCHRRGGPRGKTTASAARPRPGPPTLVTVAHLVARKRHADVLRALAVLGPRHPTLRYSIVGAGPERPALETLAPALECPSGWTSTVSSIRPRRSPRRAARPYS